MVTRWNRSPAPWTTPMIVLTALLAVAAIVVHILGQGNPSLNATGGLRNILFVATFASALLTFFTARRRRR